MSSEVAFHDIPRPSGRRRVWIWAIAAIAVVALFAGGWFAAASFQSPEQIAAGASAPQAGPITAPVLRGDLSRTVTVDTTIVRQTQLTVVLASDDAYAVITRQPTPAGSAVSNGTNLAEVNGRPRLAIQGAFPFYRDLKIGDSGPDVTQLQNGLQQAGYKISADGKFGKSTETAVKGLYRTAGYQVGTVATTPEETTPPAAGSAVAAPTVQTSTVARAELVVFSTLPGYLQSSPATGTVLDESTTITVEAGKAVATATLDAAALGELQPGMTGTLQGPDGTSLGATIESVGAPTAAPADEATAPDNSEAAPAVNDVTLVIAVDGDAVPDGWLGAQGLAIITVEVAASDSLLVPTIAVVTGADDSAHVLRQDEDGSFSRVAVRETATLAGQSAIVPADTDALSENDLVRVG